MVVQMVRILKIQHLYSFIAEYNERFAVNLKVTDVYRSTEGYNLHEIFCNKTEQQVRNVFTINLASGYIQLLNGNTPLPRPKQSVTVSKWFDGGMHIYFNDQELDYKKLKDKPSKRGFKLYAVPKDHPWGK